MSNRDVIFFLNDIFKSIERIEKYTKDMDYIEFEKDHKTFDAVIRNLEIIDEAVKNLKSEVIQKFSDINWKDASSMRDRLIHAYFGIDSTIGWETIKKDIPDFKKSIEKVMKEIN